MKTVGKFLLKAFRMIFAGIFTAITYALIFVAFVICTIARLFGFFVKIMDEDTSRSIDNVLIKFIYSAGYAPVETDE